MLPTRAVLARSVWKLPYTPAIANLREHAESKKPIKTNERSADIIPAWKGSASPLTRPCRLLPLLLLLDRQLIILFGPP